MQHISQIAPRVCTLVLFIMVAIIAGMCFIVEEVYIDGRGSRTVSTQVELGIPCGRYTRGVDLALWGLATKFVAPDL